MDDFDKTLTPEERAAPTFTEWSDATLARGVRALAANLHDSVGFNGITGMAAALALEKIARDSNAERCRITIDGGTRITVRLPNPKADARRKGTPHMSSEEKPQAPPEAPVVASGDLLAEKSAALAEKLAAEVMNYIANQFCMSKDITRSEIAALFETDVLAFLAANTVDHRQSRATFKTPPYLP